MPGIEILLEQWTTTPLTADEKPQLSLQILEKAEDITGKRVTENVSRDEWLRFLDITGKSGFLIALDTRENRVRWAEVVFRIMQDTGYSLNDMMSQRVKEHPSRVLFREMSSTTPVEWTYEQIYRHLREIAAVIHQAGEVNPGQQFFPTIALKAPVPIWPAFALTSL